MNTQTDNQLSLLKQSGFTLIEALIAFAIAGAGILAVVAFQTELIATSGQSKAKAEAIQLAQQKLEEFKNYSFDTANDFDTSYADLDDTVTSNDESVANGTAITGTNAIFERDYTIGTSGEIKDIVVTVSWTDPKDGLQSVSLNTSITFESQVIIAADNISQPPTVTSATGSANIGAGTVNCGTGEGQTPCTTNGDGTSIAEDDGDLKLVINDGDSNTEDKVVLTLEDACVSGTCTQFVQIRGSIYVDNSTQTTLAPDNVKVLSSDAGYCQRFYLEYADGTSVAAGTPVVSNTVSNTTTYYIDLDDNGIYDSATESALPLTPVTDITSAPNTPTSDYDYFRYTCYLGGGWHGNVGILLSGGNTTGDHFCLGDPNSVYLDEQPVIAARRVYRGMTYKDVDGTPLDDTSVTKETYTLPDGVTTDTRYYSAGIRDGAQLDKQDFVIAALDSADSDYCVSATAPATIPFTDNLAQPSGAMTRTDSNLGGVFADVPADYVCLNKEGHKPSGAQGANDPCLTGAANVAAGDISCHGLVDPELPYGAEYVCAYDPTSPPNTIYSVSGALSVTSATTNWQRGVYNGTSIDTSNHSNIVYTIDATPTYTNVNLDINSSQSFGNCTIADYSETSVSTPSAHKLFTSTYSCDVYDWPDDSVTGWIGDIISASEIANLFCTTPLAVSITGNSSGHDIKCIEGEQVIISGNSNIVDGLATLSAVTITGGEPVGCRVAADGSSYQCLTIIPTGSTWTGTIVFTDVGGKYVCHDYEYPLVDSTTTSVATSFASSTASYGPLSAGTYSDEDIQIENNSNGCPII